MSLPSRLLTLVVTALIGSALGWWLRDTTATKSDRTALAASEAASTSSARAAAAQKHSSGSSTTGVAPKIPVEEALTRLSASNSDDMVEMIGNIGMVTRLTDAEVKTAWAELQKQSPSKTFGGSLAAMYLWSRMSRMGEKVAPPEGWGVEEHQQGLESEEARRNVKQILSRLESGGPVSETERRVAFTEMVKTDPVNAVKLLRHSSKPTDYQRDAPWLADALTKPETRDAVMTEIRQWQANGDVSGVVSFLARNWINRDPAAVEAWLQEPAQADIRDATMNEIIHARTMENASDAWDWCQSAPLPEERRRYTLGYASQYLANQNPEEGIELIATLKDPGDRREVIGKFGPILAGSDLKQWKQWRDTLPAAEQDVANQAAFDVWARRDADGAVQWLNTRPPGEARDAMVVNLITAYATQDPESAVAWIRTIPDPNRRRQAVSEALMSAGTDNVDRVQLLMSALPR